MTFRAENIGSMLRPDHLVAARASHAAGALSAREFKEIEDRAVDAAIALQEGVGLDVVTDGELRRHTFFDQLRDAMHGTIEFAHAAAGVTFHAERAADDIAFDGAAGLAVVERIRRNRMVTVEEYVYARARARRPVKVTFPSPIMLYQMWSKERSTGAYPDPFVLFADGAELLREEIAELAALGCTYVQIDAPELGQMVDPARRDAWEAIGVSPDRALHEGVEIVNHVADVDGVTFGLHLCRGNFKSRWIAQGGYEHLSKEIFARADNYDVFLLEYDDARSGGFAPLADLPDDKIAVLGLISTKHDRIEEPRELLARIDEAGRYFPREQLALSTQCGFASIMDGNEINERAQQDKLALVARVAHEAWG